MTWLNVCVDECAYACVWNVCMCAHVHVSMHISACRRPKLLDLF